MIPLLYFGLASLGNRQTAKIFCNGTIIEDQRIVLGHNHERNHGRKSIVFILSQRPAKLGYRQIFKNSWNCGRMNRKNQRTRGMIKSHRSANWMGTP